MGISVDRSPQARIKRKPHLFLSHSSRDKTFVVQLASDLNMLGIDAWLDDWELQVGDDLYETISDALRKSEYVAIIVSEHFFISKWANDEMKQALAREHKERRNVIVPLLLRNANIPPFVENRLRLDFRKDYYENLIRLSGMIHKIAKTRVELAIDNIKPKVLADVIKALEYAGYDHYMILDSQDCDEILELGGWVEEGYIHFNFNDIASHPRASHHIRTLMKHLKRIKRERNAKMSIRW